MRALEEMQMLQQAQNANQPQSAGQFAHPFQQQMPPIQSYGNPIDAGTMSGIRAARESLEGEREQQRRAMGQAMMHIFSNMYKQQPDGTPMFGLGALARSLNESVVPAVHAHNQAREHERGLNLKLLERQDKMNERMRRDALEREKMNELKQYRNAMLGMRGAKKEKEEKFPSKDIVQTRKGPLDVSEFPKIKSVGERNAISKDYRAFSKTKNIIQDIYNNFIKLKNMSAENGDILDPTGSVLGSVPQKIKDVYGRVIGDESINEQRILRNTLGAQLENLQPQLERAVKGSAPGEQMMKHYREKNVFPTLNMPSDEIESRLKYLLEEASEQSDLGEISLQSGHIVPYIPEEEQELAVEASPEISNMVQDFKAKHPKYANASDEAVAGLIKRLISEGKKW